MFWRTVIAAAACFAATSNAGWAARGVAIDVGRIEIAQDLTPGGSYRLPTFGVRNPGDGQTAYRMGASAVVDPERKPVPDGWFRFTPNELSLKPGETKPVQARLEVPTDAEPGDYIALVGAQIVTEGGGAQVGAAAAARTTFTVEPASTLEAWWLELKTFFNDHTPWTWLVPALLVLLLAAQQARKRLSLTVARKA
jgi:hypothetical protein